MQLQRELRRRGLLQPVAEHRLNAIGMQWQPEVHGLLRLCVDVEVVGRPPLAGSADVPGLQPVIQKLYCCRGDLACNPVLCPRLQDCRPEDRQWMSRLGRVMFLVERTRRTRPGDVAAVVDCTAEQVEPSIASVQ